MNLENRIGLGNTVKSETIIFHGMAIDYDSIGRIGDQVVFWIKKHHQISQNFCGEFKVLIQTMMEFGVHDGPESINQFEVAVEGKKVFFALRFKNFIVKISEEAEKELSQFWLNSTKTQLVKKVLLPTDVVEIRFVEQLDLIEFRILRSLGEESFINNSQSFKVIVDIEPELKNDHQNFIDISDFDSSFWLKQVYDNKKNRVISG